MSDSNISGAHTTMAGSRLDPNIGSQSSTNPSQSGVHQEGIDHIKDKVGETTTIGGGLGSSAGTTDTTSGLSGGSTGTSGLGSSTERSGTSTGLGSGLTGSSSSGVDSTTYNETPGVSDEQQSTGILGTVKSYLGYGNKPADSLDERNVDDASASGYGSAAGAGLAGAGAGSALSGRDTTDSSTTGTGSGLTGREPSGNIPSGGLSSDHNSSAGLNTSSKDPAAQVAPRDTPRDSDVTTGAKPTESADPHTSDRAMTGNEESRDAGEHGSEHEKKLSDAQTGSKRTNESSIPTAGGERLGEKHWGESKIVPDNPKSSSEKGISSSEGQPTSEVRDNTSANTGGAHPPGHEKTEEGGKESVVDKIKDKLHIGHKDS